ncbi:flavoprotein [Candidatus Scalindua japonica]|uniref:Flavoprotein n=1 Tax=Candidatus Scalindua japonica TaxID=1284222 RepID=A0A286TZ35_9BACT|nr:MBL fold metallo-hydrolase [Candidatus Scalindua japonica]GAX61147.1 flavoprotein [Candidatus Scalindua japonica]
MAVLDANNSITILRDIYWVGFYDKESDLHCNAYLITDDKDIILIDPGSIPHFSIVMRKVLDIVNPGDITKIIVTHQDPDVCGNLPVVESLIDNKDLDVVIHSSCSRLIRHYGINSNIYEVDKHDNKLKLKSGRVLEFFHTPYLHSPFAMIMYDVKTKTLFTSDLLGGISKNWSLFAEKGFLESMKVWHQMTMPSSHILKKCMNGLEKLELERILPQHGSILQGDQIKEAIECLKSIKCGVETIKGVKLYE